MDVRSFLSIVFVFLISAQAQAQQGCQCTVSVGNQNRWVWGSWALECNGHKGHGDCPTTNIDTAHSPGKGAMVGKMLVQTRTNGNATSQWQKNFSDDHVTAFKGPIWTSDGWEWTNVCSCDGYNQTSCGKSPVGQWWDPNQANYSGALNDPQYIHQGDSPTMTLPYACGDSRQDIAVFEIIEENDPWSPNDPMGQIGIGVNPAAGNNTYTVWAEHYEPAYINGQRTHAGYAGGNFGAEIVVNTNCVDLGTPPPPTGDYQGCWSDDENRALPYHLGGGHTIESCINSARAIGVPYAGLQWYGECFGGYNLAYSQVGDEECNTPCNANPSQMCGGAWRNSIYSTN
ncbi:MAG: WSC domain-containing protein [Bdellovibrionia bacterium]